MSKTTYDPKSVETRNNFVQHTLYEVIRAKNHLTQQQVERLTSRGVGDDTVLETLTKIGAVSVNFVKRFIVEQIRAGRYDIHIIT